MSDEFGTVERVADTLEDIGDVCVVDLVMHTDVEAQGYWNSLTVYFSREVADIRASRWHDLDESAP